MTQPVDALARRTVRSVARRYERDGYRVFVPQPNTIPSFLSGLTPDLIAESEQDHVVIEVKRGDALRGSNDLVAVAERVAGQVGWRFELVALPSHRPSSPSPADRTDDIVARARKAMESDLPEPAYVYAWVAVEQLLADLARRNGSRATKPPARQIARNLVFQGFLDRDLLEPITAADATRDRIAHDRPPPPSAAEFEALLALIERLRQDVAAPALG